MSSISAVCSEAISSLLWASRYPLTPALASCCVRNSSRFLSLPFKICSVRCSTTDSARRPARAVFWSLYLWLFSLSWAPYSLNSSLVIWRPLGPTIPPPAAAAMSFTLASSSSTSPLTAVRSLSLLSTSSSFCISFAAAMLACCLNIPSLLSPLLDMAFSTVSLISSFCLSSCLTCALILSTSSMVLLGSSLCLSSLAMVSCSLFLSPAMSPLMTLAVSWTSFCSSFKMASAL
mmetsp:Transcript_7452/g.13480  ORF Transcript_7452/g.13480 Transcript_7452/m.13480 type:complete len:233 (+) Transcript_7452:755-1453(+)